jgi:hypothetical protein
MVTLAYLMLDDNDISKNSKNTEIRSTAPETLAYRQHTHIEDKLHELLNRRLKFASGSISAQGGLLQATTWFSTSRLVLLRA